MTKKEMYNVIADVFATVDRPETEDILAMVAKEIEALDRKSVKAKEKAAEKKAAGDALKDTIENMLYDEPMTIAEILEQIGDATLTPAKISARMSQLVKAGKAERQVVKVEGRKLTGEVRV